MDEIAGANVPRGLLINKPTAQPGYILFSPLSSGTTYLIDNAGQVVHTWESDFAPGCSAYLLDNGHLLRPAREPEVERFSSGCQGGRIQEFTWDGELVWDFLFASDQHLQHHDIEVLPNGNVLVIAWEYKSADEARWAGRNPTTVPAAGMWSDMVVEVEPQRPSGGRIVWKWHAWDHLLQYRSRRLPNYAAPSERPGRIDINAGQPPEMETEELEELKALGYLSADTTPEDVTSDLFHTNAIAYNAELDQIALSIRRYHEIWIIDHSTTPEEAAGSSGGRWGRGGDLLYRWGNPAAYGRGDESSQRLFAQHDVRWISAGRPGAGNLTVFSNHMGNHRHSAVYEIEPPAVTAGRYVVPEKGPFGPVEPTWFYRGTPESFFYARVVSGAERQPNGNTLICSGTQGRFFEVTPEGEIVWEFWDPRQGEVRLPERLAAPPGRRIPPHRLPRDEDLAGSPGAGWPSPAATRPTATQLGRGRCSSKLRVGAKESISVPTLSKGELARHTRTMSPVCRGRRRCSTAMASLGGRPRPRAGRSHPGLGCRASSATRPCKTWLDGVGWTGLGSSIAQTSEHDF